MNDIASAHGVLIATPEYNRSIPGTLKNAIDWTSRPVRDIPRVWGGRPVAIVPCAIKFEYVTDPTEQLSEVMGRLEKLLSWAPRKDMPLQQRIRRFARLWRHHREAR